MTRADLHIWSLSESKLVASMHILVKSHEEFTQCSNDVRKLLHRFGVHSSTIQPELLDGNGQTKAASVLMASRNASVEGLVPGELELDVGDIRMLTAYMSRALTVTLAFTGRQLHGPVCR